MVFFRYFIIHLVYSFDWYFLILKWNSRDQRISFLITHFSLSKWEFLFFMEEILRIIKALFRYLRRKINDKHWLYSTIQIILSKKFSIVTLLFSSNDGMYETFSRFLSNNSSSTIFPLMIKWNWSTGFSRSWKKKCQHQAFIE